MHQAHEFLQQNKKTHKNMSTILQNRTVLLLGSVYIYCLIVPHRNCRKKCRWDHSSLQKWRKIGDFKVDFLKIFLCHSPRTPILGRGYGAPPHTQPPQLSGASRLRALLGTFGPSIVRKRTSTGMNFLGPGKDGYRQGTSCWLLYSLCGT